MIRFDHARRKRNDHDPAELPPLPLRGIEDEAVLRRLAPGNRVPEWIEVGACESAFF
jgi:hypothetical protein